MKDTILEVKDLSVTFTQYDRGFSRRTLHAVEKMDLSVRAGEIVAVVGSSGSGKSLLAHAIMGILPYNSAMDGEIRFLGTPLTAERVKKLRGHEIVFVPQSVSYLDPLMKIGDQIRNGKKDREGEMSVGAKALWPGPGYPGKISVSAIRRHDAARSDLHSGDGNTEIRHCGRADTWTSHGGGNARYGAFPGDGG